MALKFLNKKGWHTGSLRNIENVWKAEQKADAEQKKLEELRKQIQEEREKSEFRLLQEQAGLVPKQERLDFLYDSGLAVGKGSSDGFKALEAMPKTESDPTTSSSSKQQSSAPGALFEEKPQSANDAWRKLHSDPLLLIRQREQEALARIKNNPIQMARIKESVKPKKDEKLEEKERKKRRKSTRSSSKDPLDDTTSKGEERRERSHRSKGHHHDHPSKGRSDSESELTERWERKERSHHKSKHGRSDLEADSVDRRDRRNRNPYHKSKHSRSDSENELMERWERKERSHHKSKHGRSDSEADAVDRRDRSPRHKSKHSRSDSEADSNERRERSKKRTSYDQKPSNYDRNKSTETDRPISDTKTPTEADWRSRSRHKPRQPAVKLSEEERAARLREMQMDAEVHEEQRWKRLKKASEDDALEEKRSSSTQNKQPKFLDAAQKSVYGAEKGGSSTIEESVRRRTYFLQGSSAASETNAFRR